MRRFHDDKMEWFGIMFGLMFFKGILASLAGPAPNYDMQRVVGVHLSEHGGTGQGVIGALAGAGLRLSGNDGRLKGHLEIADAEGWAAVSDICSHIDVDEVRSLNGPALKGPERVKLGEKVKTVLLEGKSVLLVEPVKGAADGTAWQTCSKQQLRSY